LRLSANRSGLFPPSNTRAVQQLCSFFPRLLDPPPLSRYRCFPQPSLVCSAPSMVLFFHLFPFPFLSSGKHHPPFAGASVSSYPRIFFPPRCDLSPLPYLPPPSFSHQGRLRWPTRSFSESFSFFPLLGTIAYILRFCSMFPPSLDPRA